MGTNGTGTPVTSLAGWSRTRPHGGDRRHHPRRRRLIGVPAAGSEDFRLWTEWLGRCLAATGAAGIDAHLADFASTALELGVEPMHAHVVADPASSGARPGARLLQGGDALRRRAAGPAGRLSSPCRG